MDSQLKQSVLVKMYQAHKKDSSNMDQEISPETIGVEEKRLNMALEDLMKDGLIYDIENEKNHDNIEAVALEDLKITNKGIDMVEDNGLNTEPLM